MADEFTITRDMPLSAAAVDALCALDAECFGEADVWPRVWFEEPSDSYTRWFLAWAGAELAGYCGFYANMDKTPPYGKIMKLAVKESFRRRGLGRRLLGLILEAGEREFGLIDFKLETADDNPFSHRLYADLGFKVEETVKAYYNSGSDGLIMWKRGI